MTGALARLKHALTNKEISDGKKSSKLQQQIALQECLVHGREALELGDDAPTEASREKADIEERVRQRAAPVLFVHIHKAGGTTVCNLAKLNNLTVPVKP